MDRLGTYKTKKIELYLFMMMYLWILFFYPSKAISKEEGLQRAFEVSGAKMAEYNIYARTGIPNQLQDAEEAEKLCRELAEQLGIKEPMVQRDDGQGNVQVWITGKYKEGQDIVVMVQSTQLEEVKETNFIIDLTGQEQPASIEQIGKEIKNVLKQYGEVDISTWISGTYEGKLAKKEGIEIAVNIMAGLNAKEVEGIREENLISITGYSKEISEGLRYGGNKVNIQIALRYNSHEDRTYLWIGSPLIFTAY
ncbi:YwmB family TATA-box binding protein [Thermotalea metallivorans]|uniref:TATA-box binding n=1 Tax=Thermotalea metallivorans TaxID=520762 RepID=A0A140L6U3_9FIRM|nr:YwmB family TATA-box binding protein [Thermotalea metallivorans]KXG76268.1 hypothetical protein AN619_12250 [Thermotalea metallivorans]